jgi:hypothetical protein
MTYWPPLYPPLLSLPAHIGIDPVTTARWVSALCFGLLVFASMRGTGWHCPEAPYPSVLAGLLLMLSPDTLYIYTMAWTEPLFIVLVMFGFLAAVSDHECQATHKVVAAGAITSLAVLTRYAGAFFATAIAALVAGRHPSRRRLELALVFTAVVGLPLALWVA